MFFPLRLFALASLAIVPLLVAGALLGGGWIVTALVYITLFAFLADEAGALAGAGQPEASANAADRLLIVLATAHALLLPLGALAVAGSTGLSPAARVAAFFSFGLFLGQVSNPVAHELIHRRARWLNRTGRWMFISLLFGHHASAHPLVHHVHVGTDSDPNSARLGENFYHWVGKAWTGSFRQGLRAERERRDEAPIWQTPYIVYLSGAAGCLAVAALVGPRVLTAYLALALYAQAQLLLSDYVQHYGLRRRILPSGKPEPVSPRHSWNAPHWFTTLMMVAAPRHSDHHAHPTRPFPELTLPEGAPLLPYSLPAMATLALFPTLWRRVMDKRVRRWQATGTEPSPLPRSA